MNIWPQVDFPKLVEKVLNSRIDNSELAILGGQCTEKDLLNFIDQWRTKFHFRIWEYASEIVFEIEKAAPSLINVSLLERGRLFGKDGDLSLRREGDRFYWNFVGPAGTHAPEGNFGTRNYWDTINKHRPKTFHQYHEKTLLWGELNNGRWHELRVAGAQLDYPVEGKRIQLEYKVLSNAGQISFVWYTGLSEWEETGHA